MSHIPRIKPLLILIFVLTSVFCSIQVYGTETTQTTKVFTAKAYGSSIWRGGDDYTYAHTAISGTINTSIWIGQEYYYDYEPVYVIFRGFVYFDTSEIEGVILSATLSLYVQTNSSTQDFDVVVQNGQPWSPHVPLDSLDYWEANYWGDGGSGSTATISALNYWNISLGSDGKTWINKDGTTKLCLRSARDIDSLSPVTYEYIQVKPATEGSTYAPKLYVTYETATYKYIIHGPYYEDGTVANVNVTVTVQFENLASQTYTLDGDGGADTVTSETAERGVALSWNISSSLNQSRTFYLMEDYEEVWIYIPNPSDPYYLYSFTLTDFAGITNGYIETLIYVQGELRIVERQKADVVNALPFWLTWGKRYDVRLICDKGTYIWGGFIASVDQSQSLIITQDMFPVSYPSMNVTVNAVRRNDTWIQINYSDSEVLTLWVYVNIKYRSGFGYTSAYTVNGSGSSQQVNWNNADNNTNYVVDVSAYRDGDVESWSFSCPIPAGVSNPWAGLFDVLGTFPFPAANLFFVAVILMFMGVFSYWTLAAGCVITWIMALFLVAIGWASVPWSLLGLAGFVVFLVVIKEAKKVEREI